MTGENVGGHAAGRARADNYRVVSFGEIRLWLRHGKAPRNPSDPDIRVALCKTPTIANACGAPKSKKSDRSPAHRAHPVRRVAWCGAPGPATSVGNLCTRQRELSSSVRGRLFPVGKGEPGDRGQPGRAAQFLERMVLVILLYATPAIFIRHVAIKRRRQRSSSGDAEAHSATTDWSQARASGSLARSAGPSGEPRKIKVPLPTGLFDPTASDLAQPITSPRFADTGITRVKSRTIMSRGQT